MEAADFSGYATRSGLKCSDGRTIMPEAFQHMDGVQIPLVWQHGHGEVTNILGHAILEARSDGMYAYGFFNESPPALHAKEMLRHKDVDSLSIYANELVERSQNVYHGQICELSLVIKGANSGAKIENVNLAHADGEVYATLENEARIWSGEFLESTFAHSDFVAAIEADEAKEAGDGDDPEDEKEGEENPEDGEQSAQEIFDTFSDEQKEVVHAMLGAALTDKGVENIVLEHAAGEKSMNEIFNTLTDEQKAVVHFMIGAALEASAVDAGSTGGSTASHSAISGTPEGDLTHQEGNVNMTRNVFDQNDKGISTGATLSHAQFATVLGDVKAHNGSFRDSMLAHAGTFGINDIELLFPDAKTIANTPELKSRRMEWVAKVLDGTKHTPFAKVKSLVFDITAEEARAKGYIKGNRKKDEVISLLRRTTGPTTIYKKQRLDRDDVIDITDIDVVAFLKAEIRLMLEEEIARAILVGDGRPASSEDKIKDPAGSLQGDGIRSILHDDDLYSIKYPMAANSAPKDSVKGLVRARSQYRGTGKPTLFIADSFLTDIMLEEDKFGRPLYETEASLRDKLRVSDIVTVDLFDEYENVFAIMVNLIDYSIGSNKGGELTSFEDFDIDFNQMKYLQETRLSGGLTKPFSAIVVTRQMGTKVTPTAPSFNGETNTITVPTVAGVVYLVNGESVEGDVVIETDTTVDSAPDEGYYFPNNITRDWSFTYTA